MQPNSETLAQVPAGDWKEVITADDKLLAVNLKELWNYRDLLLIFTKRDITAIYKQTILGPLWFFLQPALTTVVYILVFSKAGKLSTDQLPPVLFYISGLIIWMYFSECILKTSNFLKDNAPILTKVYFPRLILPISIALTNLVKLGIQLLLFFSVYLFYFFNGDDIQPNPYALLFPLLIFFIGLFGLGSGIIVSSLTTKYKDLSHLVVFAVQLMMFASPVIFPLSSITDPFLLQLLKLNPVSGIIEAFRFGFLGKGYLSWSLLLYDFAVITIILLTSLITFNRVQRQFVDTI
ncbi:MAG: ABC transporter permease [Chitinophagaceae bacterium]|nr:ABC transporter permease [Chitinophagaceae bacterium]